MLWWLEEKKYLEKKISKKLKGNYWKFNLFISRNLKNLLNKQKIQYLGCIPLWSEETYLNKLKMINEEKHNAFLKLHEAKLIENEAALLKEQLQIEMNLMKQQKELLSKGEKDDAKAVMNWMQEKKNLKINVSTIQHFPFK